jgi:acyl-CoA thioester hydrolase
MMFNTEFTIEWGDCDEAGIVFYPNYFYWFDCSFHRMLRDRGLSQRELKRRFNAVTPLVDAGSKFLAPARYDDVLRVTAAIDSWETKRFRIRYDLFIGSRQVVEGFEIRAWAQIDESGKLRGRPVEPAFKDLMQ